VGFRLRLTEERNALVAYYLSRSLFLYPGAVYDLYFSFEDYFKSGSCKRDNCFTVRAVRKK